jgi:hypothetical protein
MVDVVANKIKIFFVVNIIQDDINDFRINQRTVEGILITTSALFSLAAL